MVLVVGDEGPELLVGLFARLRKCIVEIFQHHFFAPFAPNREITQGFLAESAGPLRRRLDDFAFQTAAQVGEILIDHIRSRVHQLLRLDGVGNCVVTISGVTGHGHESQNANDGGQPRRRI